MIAIEAHPLTQGYLARNIAMNAMAQATALHLALGAEPGTVTMSYTDANPGETHVGAGVAAGVAAGGAGPGKSAAVPRVTAAPMGDVVWFRA